MISSRHILSRICFAFALIFAALCANAETILDSKHNLSASGPGTVRAVSEQRVCIFCHTPHGARDVAPLWNRDDPNVSYQPYDSPTLKASVGQPTGASKLCLSCHDGTIALGDLVSESTPVSMAGGATMPAGPGLIGTDLRDDHPISFNYLDSLAHKGGELTPPASWAPQVKLDANSQVQCTTCHDPHDNQFGRFLAMSNQRSALCQQCHVVNGFQQTPHAQSTAQWNGAGLNPWPYSGLNDVQSNACTNCHVSHHAGGQEELLTYAREEDTCFSCHNGNVASANLQAVFEKPSRHPVSAQQGVHHAGESPLAAAGHVECADCHNPHRAHKAPASAPFVMGGLEGVSGLDGNGAPVTEAVYEYQVCLKCHSTNGTPGSQGISRQVPSHNLMKDFNPASPSFHPVEAAGRGTDVPSLIPPLTTASQIYCSDCHGNDSAVAGTAGPHGSNFEFLLVRQYRTGDNIAESPTAYALCYGCHNRDSIMRNETFKHLEHVVDDDVSCSVCHDGHGIDFGAGNPTNNAHLINFDRSIVDRDPATGRLEYHSNGARSGECFLSCHGVAHSPKSY